MGCECAITIYEQEATIIKECEVGGHEAILAPGACGVGVFTRRVDLGVHGGVFLPDGFAVEGHFGEGFDLLVGCDVEEFL